MLSRSKRGAMKARDKTEEDLHQLGPCQVGHLLTTPTADLATRTGATHWDWWHAVHSRSQIKGDQYSTNKW